MHIDRGVADEVMAGHRSPSCSGWTAGGYL